MLPVNHPYSSPTVIHLHYKNVVKTNYKACDPKDEPVSPNKSQGGEEGENQLAATVSSRWGRAKTDETTGLETSSFS